MSHPAQERLGALRARLRERCLGALVVSSPSNIYYLSGFRGSSGALLVGPTRAALFSDFRYRLQAAEQAPDWEFVEVERRLLHAVGERAREWAAAPLGYDPEHLTCARRQELSQGAGDLELAEAPGLVEELRAVKSEEEIAAIRAAAALADEALAHILSLVRPGATERALALEGEFLMRRRGAQAAFDIIVASGPRSALPHAETTDRELKEGDLLLVDIGARLDGYCSDLTRTFAVGSASARARELYALVYRAQRAGVAALAPGARAGEVDGAARTVIAEAGWGEAFGHGLGHGVGIDVHEAPRLARQEERELAVGNVVTIEPGIYAPDLGGVRLEDLLVVRPGSAETLTGAPLPAELPTL